MKIVTMWQQAASAAAAAAAAAGRRSHIIVYMYAGAHCVGGIAVHHHRVLPRLFPSRVVQVINLGCFQRWWAADKVIRYVHKQQIITYDELPGAWGNHWCM